MSAPHESPLQALGTPLGRRTFLHRALVAGSLAGAASLMPQAGHAAEPPVRNGKSHLKLSLAAYSFRKYLTGAEPSMSLEDFIRLCADLNLDGCELTSYYFPNEITTDYLLHLKALTHRLGLGISGTAIRNDFCLPPGPKRDEWLAHTRRWVDYSALLGAPVIRIFAGTVPAGDTEEAAIARCIEGINESLDYAAQKGVILALENHGGVTATAEQMLKIVAGVKESPWFGVNFDSGNFRTADPYSDLAKIAPYAVNAQVKTEIAPGGKSEEADLPRLIRVLTDAKYRGYVTLEYEAAEEPKTAVPRYIAELRATIGAPIESGAQ